MKLVRMLAERWDRFWFTPGSATTLGVCRLLFYGGLFVWQLPHDFSPWGSYSSVFWMPMWLFDTLGLPAFSPATLAVLQLVWKASLLLSAVGLFTRPAMAVAFVVGTYLMGLPHNFGQTQHFDTLVVFASGALMLSRAGDACSLDALLDAARLRRRAALPESGEYTWPIRFVWVAFAAIFFAAGVSKLRHSGLDWILSDNLASLLIRQQYHISDGEPLTAWGLVVARHAWLSRAIAGCALSIETLFPLTLVSRRARMVLAPAGLAFLAGIRVLMGPTFEQFMIAFVFWVPWAAVGVRVRGRLAGWQNRLVLYDAQSGRCSRTVNVLSSLNVLGKLSFADIGQAWPQISGEYPALDLEGCRNTICVVPAGTPAARVRRGVDGSRDIAWRVPALWPALAVLYLPGAAFLGRLALRLVSSRRRHEGRLLPRA